MLLNTILFSFEHELEHEFIANGDSCNVICSVSLDGSHDRITLTSVCRIVIFDYVNACEDLNVGLGLLNCLELKQRKGVASKIEQRQTSSINIPPLQFDYSQLHKDGFFWSAGT